MSCESRTLGVPNATRNLAGIQSYLSALTTLS